MGLLIPKKIWVKNPDAEGGGYYRVQMVSSGKALPKPEHSREEDEWEDFSDIGFHTKEEEFIKLFDNSPEAIWNIWGDEKGSQRGGKDFRLLGEIEITPELKEAILGFAISNKISPEAWERVKEIKTKSPSNEYPFISMTIEPASREYDVEDNLLNYVVRIYLGKDKNNSDFASISINSDGEIVFFESNELSYYDDLEDINPKETQELIFSIVTNLGKILLGEKFSANKISGLEGYYDIYANTLKGKEPKKKAVYRMMSPKEFESWRSGEVIPKGKFFAENKQFAQSSDFDYDPDSQVYRFYVSESDYIPDSPETGQIDKEMTLDPETMTIRRKEANSEIINKCACTSVDSLDIKSKIESLGNNLEIIQKQKIKSDISVIYRKAVENSPKQLTKKELALCKKYLGSRYNELSYHDKELLSSVESEISERKISEKEILRLQYEDSFIIGGYASVNVVDREGHRITIPALRNALRRFMFDPAYRNLNVFHSDVQIGKILPKVILSDGRELKSEVDDRGFYAVAEVRDDVDVGKKVQEEIEKGNLRSYSIAGNAKKKESVCENGRCFYDINDLDIFETTICEEGVNSESKFELFQKQLKFCDFCKNCKKTNHLLVCRVLSDEEKKIIGELNVVLLRKQIQKHIL